MVLNPDNHSVCCPDRKQLSTGRQENDFMRRIFILLFILILYPIDCCYSDTDLPKESTVKVLLYHNVTAAVTDQNNPYVVPLAEFEEQIRWLQENGYECLTVSEMFQRFSEGEITGKTAVITFDDGYPDVYTYAFPVLSVYGFPATTYLVASKIDSPKNLTAEMIRDLYDAEWEIGSHSMTHSDLMNHEDLDSEICGSRNLIAAMTGIPLSDVVSFAYPYGNADEIVITKVWKCGYLSGAGLGQIPVSASQNPCYFSRHPVTSDMKLEDFTALFLHGDEK